MLELSEVKRIYNNRQRELTEDEVGISKLKVSNLDLRKSLMEALIKKEELLTKKSAVICNLDRLDEQLENLEKEADSILDDEKVDTFCARNSTTNQRNILNKIQDAKSKLIDYGLQPSQIHRI